MRKARGLVRGRDDNFEMMYLRHLFIKYVPYLKNSGIYFFSSLFVALVGVLLNPVYAMNLSHEDYAILGYYQSFNLLLVPLLHFSLFSFYSRHYYFVPEDERDELGDTVLLSSIVIGFFSLVVFTGGFYLKYKYWGGAFPFFPFAILTFLQLYIGSITSFQLIKLRVRREARSYAKVSLSQFLLVSLFSLVLVVYYKYGAEGKLWGTLVATVLVAAYSLCKSITHFRINKTLLKRGLKFSYPLTISALLWYFLTGVDRAFLASLDDKMTYGLYSVGLQMAGYMSIFYTTIANTFEPDIYQSIAQGKKKKLLVIMGVIVGTVSFFNLLFVVFAPFVIGVLTANRYVDAAPFAQILALHNISMACYYMVVKLLIGYGYVKTELLVRIVGAGLSVLMFYVLIRYYGFMGAAWGQVLSFVLLTVLGLMAFYCKKRNASLVVLE